MANALATNRPLDSNYLWFTLPFTELGGGVRYPLGGEGGLSTGGNQAARLASSDIADLPPMAFWGWMVTTPIAGASSSIDLEIVDAATGTTVKWTFNHPTLAPGAQDATYNSRPRLFLPQGLRITNGFGARIATGSGTPTAGAIAVLYQILA